MAKNLRVDAGDPQSLSESIPEIQSILNEGKVIAFPTDTFYGLGADPSNPSGLKRIFDIKRRPLDKPLLILVASPKDLECWVTETSPLAMKALEHFWPGPLTLVFRARSSVSPMLTAGTGKIGIRCPDNPFTRSLIEHLGHPLTAPSANFSGHPEPKTAEEVAHALGSWVDLIVDAGPSPRTQVSSVLDTTTDPPGWLREGAISREHVEAALHIMLRAAS